MVAFEEINGTRLQYEMAGQGQAVVLVHGEFLDMRIWDAPFHAIARRHRAVRYDLRGHGKSELPLQAYSHARDLHGLFQRLGIESAWIVGHSLGAAVALEFALERPALVRGLAFLAPYLRGHGLGQPHLARIDRVRAVARQHGAGRARQIWLERDTLLDPVRKKPAVYARLAEIAGSYTYTDLLRPPMEHSPQPDYMHHLPDLAAPALVLVGELDAPDIRAAAAALHAGIPNARTTVIPEAGHFLPVEQPEAVSWTLIDFVSQREETAGPQA